MEDINGTYYCLPTLLFTRDTYQYTRRGKSNKMELKKIYNTCKVLFTDNHTLLMEIGESEDAYRNGNIPSAVLHINSARQIYAKQHPDCESIGYAVLCECLHALQKKYPVSGM